MDLLNIICFADLVIKTRNKLLYTPISLYKVDLSWNYFVSDILCKSVIGRKVTKKS